MTHTAICLILPGVTEHPERFCSFLRAVALTTKVVVGEAKAALVAVRPLEVVNEGPGGVACPGCCPW